MIDLAAYLDRLNLGDSLREDVHCVMAQKDRALEMLLRQLMEKIELTSPVIEQRLVPLVIQQAMIHLADDLADGDCDYLPDVQARGPTTQYTLQNLVSWLMMDAAVSADCLIDFYRRMALVGSAQHEEIRTQVWSLEESRAAAEAMGGELYAAYFSVASDGTSFSEEAADLGYRFGCAMFVARDIRSKDDRYYSLKTEDQNSLRQWAMDAANWVGEHGLDPLNRQLLPAYHYLR